MDAPTTATQTLSDTTLSPHPSVPEKAAGIGTFFVLILYGTICQQTLYYFWHYRSDGCYFKAISSVLFICATLHAILVMHICYVSLVLLKEDDTADVILGLWSFWLIIPTTTLVNVICYSFYARRVFYLCGGSVKFVFVMGGTLLTILSLAIVSTVHAFRTGNSPLISIFAVTEVAIGLTVDIGLTSRLAYFLHTSRTGLRSTDCVINRLMFILVNSGLITSILMVVSMILLLASPQFFSFPAITTIAPVHAGVVLAAINARRSIIDGCSGGLEIRSVELDIRPRSRSREQCHTCVLPGQQISDRPGDPGRRRSCAVSGTEQAQVGSRACGRRSLDTA